MSDLERIFIAIDDSEASKKALSYVGRIIGTCRNYEIHVCHILQPCPTELLEFPGAEDSKEEERMDAEVVAKQQQWAAEQEKSAEGLLEESRAILLAAGAAVETVSTHSRMPIDHQGLPAEILAAASENSCHTIAVGRESFSRFKSLLSKHVGDELVRKAKGATIWVIE